MRICVKCRSQKLKEDFKLEGVHSNHSTTCKECRSDSVMSKTIKFRADIKKANENWKKLKDRPTL